MRSLAALQPWVRSFCFWFSDGLLSTSGRSSGLRIKICDAFESGAEDLESVKILDLGAGSG